MNRKLELAVVVGAILLTVFFILFTIYELSIFRTNEFQGSFYFLKLLPGLIIVTFLLLYWLYYWFFKSIFFGEKIAEKILDTSKLTFVLVSFLLIIGIIIWGFVKVMNWIF